MTFQERINDSVQEARRQYENRVNALVGHVVEMEDKLNGGTYCIVVEQIDEKGFCRCFQYGKEEEGRIRVSINWVEKGTVLGPYVKPEAKNPDHIRKQIAANIYHQLGGNQFKAMVGMYNGAYMNSGLVFRFKGSRKANCCRITYVPGSDLYTFELLKVHGINFKEVYKLEGVYDDMLQDLFRSETGLDTSL